MPTWLLIAIGVGVGYLIVKGSSKTNIKNLDAQSVNTLAAAVESIFKETNVYGNPFTVGADTVNGFCLYDKDLISQTVTSSAAYCSMDWVSFCDGAAAYIAKKAATAYSPTSLANRIQSLRYA